MDLSQAEAVAEIITAKTDIALNIAERQLEGAIREEISLLEKGLLNLLSFCETMLDFADENEINQDYDVIGKAKSIRKKIAFLIQTSESGIIIREGITIVIAGHPNAGKSSLFNLLTGKDRAIVTDIPGTTRDTIEEDAQIEGIYVRLIDTAGIREADDLIERLGIERSRKSIAHADIVLWILDLASPHEEQLKEIKKHTSEKINTIAVWNKLDLFPSKKKEKIQDGTVHNLMISVKKNIGITDLKNTIKKIVWGDNKNKDIPAFAINLRHRSLLEKTLENLDSAESHVAAQEWELAALFLRQAISSLKEITGENVSLDVLDIIFSKFCIGK
jgi:tRNA modification GTPase